MIQLTIQGNPKALKRHRMSWRGGKPHSYDPSGKDKRDFIVQIKAPKSPLKGAIKLKATFYMPRPKSHYRTGKFVSALKDTAPMWHTGTPDIDNLLKFIMDALNGITYKDDSQIALLYAEKIYDENPRTEIRMEEI